MFQTCTRQTVINQKSKLKNIPSQGNKFLANPFYFDLANRIVWLVCELRPIHQKTTTTKKSKCFHYYYLCSCFGMEQRYGTKISHNLAKIELPQVPFWHNQVGKAVA